MGGTLIQVRVEVLLETDIMVMTETSAIFTKSDDPFNVHVTMG